MNKALLTLSALALAVGCQSTPKMKAPVDHYNSCDFDKRISVDDGIDQDVPQEAIALAWQVYRQGNCDRAIAIMHDIRQRFRSKHRNFSADCQADICMMYLRSGKLAPFKENAASLLQSRTIYSPQYKNIEKAYKMVLQEEAVN